MEHSLNSYINRVLSLLPNSISAPVEEACIGRSVEEIRIRVNRPTQIVFSNGELLLESIKPTYKDAVDILEKLCGHSVYSHEEELRNGFITLEGGVRVGVCGRAFADHGQIKRINDISSFNIRVAREVIGCAEDVIRFVTDRGRPVSSLIVAPPGGGKTTLLRDIARCLSNGIGASPVKVCIADERGELSGCSEGIPSYDIGKRTDVFELAPKSEAIAMLIRTMSPEVIITDELGGVKDAEAISEAARCGVSIIASAHASSGDELNSRESLKCVMSSGVFRRILLLKRSGSILRIVPLKA